MEAPIDSPGLITILIGAVSIYLMVPAGIPFLTPASTFVGMVRSINFAIGFLVAIFLYSNDFTLIESVFIGTFWTAYLAYLITV